MVFHDYRHKLAEVSDNRFNMLHENDKVGNVDDSVSQAITAAVLDAVEDSKPDHCMFKRVLLYQRQIYVELVAGIAVLVMQWPCLYIFETHVYHDGNM